MPKKIYDHKILGRDLKLFTFPRSTPGYAFWHPAGVILYEIILNYIRDLLKDLDYQEIKTPTIFNTELFKKSGHFDNYKDKMYFCGNKKEWGIKPMNCPESMLVFNEYMRTYKDLPLRFSDFGVLHRAEQAGEINGLFRAREFVIDDAHIYCTFAQIKKEIADLIVLVTEVYQKFGFSEYKVELSTRPKKFIGDEKTWDKAENELKEILRDKKIKFKENKGEGAFYGPKIDFHIKDSLSRSWQLGTIQLDFASTKRLEVNFINERGEKENPVLIHRALLGSLERFIAILLEHTAGALPFWLSPIQAIVLPITERHAEYANKILEELKKEDIRAEIDQRNETLPKKIRDAELQKIPYMLVVGDKEAKNQKVAVRSREKGDLGQKTINELENLLK